MTLARQVIVRAKFALGGKAMCVCETTDDLVNAIQECVRLSPVAEVSVQEIHVGSEDYVRQMERIREWEEHWTAVDAGRKRRQTMADDHTAIVEPFEELLLKPDTVVHICGWPVLLKDPTLVKSSRGNIELVRRDLYLKPQTGVDPEGR